MVVDFPHADVLMPARIDAASVMFTHNVEAEIFERHAARARGIWRLVWAAQSRKMRRFEAETLRALRHGHRRVQARCRRRWLSAIALPVVETIDTGVDLDFFALQPPQAAPDPGPDGGTLVFTATMSWAANVEGIHFLLDEVWPLLLRARPKLRGGHYRPQSAGLAVGQDPGTRPERHPDRLRRRHPAPCRQPRMST